MGQAVKRGTCDTRDLIKREAVRLFGERGVGTVSVRDIAGACEMTAPNLYSHFDSKEDLVAELIEEGYGDYGRAFVEATSGTGSFRSKLGGMVRLVLRLHDEDGLRFRFLVVTQSGYLGDAPSGPMNPVEIVCRNVVDAMERQEIPRRDPALMAAAILGLVVQTAIFQCGRVSGSFHSQADEIVGMCERIAQA